MVDFAVWMTIAPMGVRAKSSLVNGGKMLLTKLDENAEDAAALLALLANGKRLTIVEHLLDNEMSVGAIAEKVDLSQSALSQHLARLRSMNLVETRRDRQMVFYSCRSPSVRRLLETLEDIFGKR